MYQILFSEYAKSDMQSILKYIKEALQNPIVANNLLKNMHNAIYILQNHPYAGKKVEKIGELRRIYYKYPVNNYMIFYYLEKEKIVIYRIKYAKSNFDMLHFR